MTVEPPTRQIVLRWSIENVLRSEEGIKVFSSIIAGMCRGFCRRLRNLKSASALCLHKLIGCISVLKTLLHISTYLHVGLCLFHRLSRNFFH